MPRTSTPGSSSPARSTRRYYKQPEALVAARREETRALNPNVDRSPAVIYQVDVTKLVIILQRPNLTKPTRVDYHSEVDWSDGGSVSALNLWRGNVFRYWLGTLPTSMNRSGEGPFQKYGNYSVEEQAWLFQEAKNSGDPWAQITKRFNEKFGEEQPLGCQVPLSVRTSKQLHALYTRLRKKEARRLGTKDHAGDNDGVTETGSESELEEGEIREDPRAQKSTRPWEL